MNPMLSEASGSGEAASRATPPRMRRRNRLITSCFECRRRKLKCDRSQPCMNCTRSGRQCLYLALASDPAAQARLAELKDRMGALEKTLEDDARRGSVSRRRSSVNIIPGTKAEQEDNPDPDPDPDPEGEPYIEAVADTAPEAYLDAAYEEDADDDLLDLGFLMGKIRITERVGGYVRPRLGEEISEHLLNASNPVASSALSSGPLSPDVSFIKPSQEYITPSSSFFFAQHAPASSLVDFLPSRTAADRLLLRYWESVHPLARIVHRPSFQRQYEFFWQCISLGYEPQPSLHAKVFAAMLASAASIGDEAAMHDYGVPRKTLIATFRAGTELGLSQANFLKTTKLETVQALVMYLIPQCRREVSRAHSALTGTAIRLAECMGLHRDGVIYGLSPIEVHVRRLIWYQLCILDVRTCDATGPRPLVCIENFDTQFPLNIDEDDLESATFRYEDSQYFTDMTLCRIRFECNEMHRLIWVERPRVDEKKITLMALLSRIERFRREMEGKYYPMIDESVPIQSFAKKLLTCLLFKAHTVVVNRYRPTDGTLTSPRMRQLNVRSSLIQLETAIALETTPSFKSWWWYTGAFQQYYHPALILLLDIYENPDLDEAPRIWNCLDYLFDTRPQVPAKEKARTILHELSEKSVLYRTRRKLKAPVTAHTFRPESSKPKARQPLTRELTLESPSPSSQVPAVGYNHGFFPEQSQSMYGTFATLYQAPAPTASMQNPFLSEQDAPQTSISAKPSGTVPAESGVPIEGQTYLPQIGHVTWTPEYTGSLPPPEFQEPSGGARTMDDSTNDTDWSAWERLFQMDAEMGSPGRGGSANT